MFKVYSRPGSGSVVVEAVLEEAQAPYTIEIVERDTDGRPPASYRRINPMAQVPALVLADGSVMTELGAIVVYLADMFPQAALAPPINDPQRAAYLRWMFFLATNIYMTDLRLYYPARYVDDAGASDAVRNAAEGRMAEEWEIYAEAHGSKPFMLGEKMSAVDIYAAMLATWNLDVPAFFAKHPSIKAMYDRVLARPAIAKVWARNAM